MTTNLRTEDSCKRILEGLGEIQRLGWVGVCPRCGYRPMSPKAELNSLSRHVDTYICPSCGMEEAMEAAAREKPIPFKEWALFRGPEQVEPTKPAKPERDTFINADPHLRDALGTKKIYALGLELDLECPDNDCQVFKNIFNMARELDGALDIIGGYTATVLRSKLHQEIRSLYDMWGDNHAVVSYRLQHGKEGPQQS